MTSHDLAGRRPTVYGRNSQAKTKSINDQITLGIATSRRLLDQAPVIYSDSTSASKYRRAARGDWDRLVADVEAGLIDWLWLWETSRGSREAWEWLRFLHLCERHGVLIFVESHGGGRTYDPRDRRDWKTLAEEGVDADEESRKISERVRRGQGASAQEGRPAGQTLYGYRRVYHPNSGEYLRQEPDTGERPWGDPASVVRWLFREVRRGRPLLVLATELDARGVPCPRLLAATERPSKKSAEDWGALRWKRGTIRDMLRNRAYLGERWTSGTLAKAQAWPPLVDADLFHAVGVILASRSGTKPTEAVHLLSYIATCGHCGERLSAATHGTRTRPRLRCDAHHCAAPMDLCEAEVTAWVLRWIAKPGHIAALAQLEESDEVRQARAKADDKRAELARWQAKLNDPNSGLDPDDFATRKRVLVAEIEDAEARSLAASTYATTQEFGDARDAEHVARIWAGLKVYRRRDIVRELADVRLFSAGKGDTSSMGGELAPGRLVIEPRID